MDYAASEGAKFTAPHTVLKGCFHASNFIVHIEPRQVSICTHLQLLACLRLIKDSFSHVVQEIR